MIKIELKKQGNFLSGRSRAIEIVNDAGKIEMPVVLDFSGIDWVTQSFISELLVALHDSGISLNEIKIEGVVKHEIESRVFREIERLQFIFSNQCQAL